MTPSLQFRLKPGQRIYVNGAVLRVDRKVAIEFMNDVTFMLDSHVLQVEDATTPLKQLYYTVQVILMDPSTAPGMRNVLSGSMVDLIAAFQGTELHAELDKVSSLLGRERYFECLKTLRSLFDLEALILEGHATQATTRVPANAHGGV